MPEASRRVEEHRRRLAVHEEHGLPRPHARRASAARPPARCRTGRHPAMTSSAGSTPGIASSAACVAASRVLPTRCSFTVLVDARLDRSRCETTAGTAVGRAEQHGRVVRLGRARRPTARRPAGPRRWRARCPSPCPSSGRRPSRPRPRWRSGRSRRRGRPRGGQDRAGRRVAGGVERDDAVAVRRCPARRSCHGRSWRWPAPSPIVVYGADDPVRADGRPLDAEPDLVGRVAQRGRVVDRRGVGPGQGDPAGVLRQRQHGRGRQLACRPGR